MEQMLGIIRSLHEKGIIHRNLNPNKFLFGKEQTSDILSSKMIKKEINVDPHTQLYLIDYSSAKFYIQNENNKLHMKFDPQSKDFYFTNKNFCSIWAELKMEQSRRDDLYSLFYIMIYLFLGKLPWMSIKCKSKTERREKVRNLKLCLSNFELCQKINLIISNEVELFAFYLNGLTFDDEPNYAYLNQLIVEMQKKLIKSQNEEYIYPVITILN
jgi:serine/threonine protein kinase